MAAGWQLRDLLYGLRAETGKSLSSALGVQERETLIVRLRQTQELLAAQYDWPALTARRPVTLTAAGRYYALPADMPADNVRKASVRERDRDAWLELRHGIEDCHYSQVDSDAGDSRWPVERWQARERGAVLEVWPIPDRAGTLMLQGQLAPAPMVADSDTSTLDGQLIVLFTAADILARQGSEDGQLVLSRAQRLLRMLITRQDADKDQPMIIGGGPPRGPSGLAGGQRFRVRY